MFKDRYVLVCWKCEDNSLFRDTIQNRLVSIRDDPIVWQNKISFQTGSKYAKLTGRAKLLFFTAIQRMTNIAKYPV